MVEVGGWGVRSHAASVCGQKKGEQLSHPHTASHIASDPLLLTVLGALVLNGKCLQVTRGCEGRLLTGIDALFRPLNSHPVAAPLYALSISVQP